jgi:hypothetical protein
MQGKRMRPSCISNLKDEKRCQGCARSKVSGIPPAVQEHRTRIIAVIGKTGPKHKLETRIFMSLRGRAREKHIPRQEAPH